MTHPSANVLVVDDDAKFRSIVRSGLAEFGFRTAEAADATSARALLESDHFDVILLDIMMPEVTGWEFLERLRADDNSIPVMFVSARESVEERVKGLRLGADDYIIKPFVFAELVARIEAILRRHNTTHELTFGRFRLDAISRSVFVGDHRLDLSPIELGVLRALIERQGATASKSALLAEVWHTEHDPGTNVVEVHIARLRRKLERSDAAKSIETVRGEGYRIAPDPAAETP